MTTNNDKIRQDKQSLHFFLMIHIENINLLFSEKAGILKCAVGFICKNMDIDIVKSSYKSILINTH